MAARKKLFKVVILGDSQVGKTSILHQLVDERFTQQYRPTVGADLMAKELQIDGNSVTLQIWDTAGQERFQNLGGSFYKGSDLCILTFDITNEDTFNSLDQWKAAFLEYSSAEENGLVPFVLLGNKVDRDVDRKVTSDQANNWCNRNGRIQYYEVSAKENIRIKEAFEAVGKAVLTSTKDESVIMPVANLNNRPGQHDNSSKCSC